MSMKPRIYRHRDRWFVHYVASDRVIECATWAEAVAWVRSHDERGDE